jgi:citrate synthase
MAARCERQEGSDVLIGPAGEAKTGLCTADESSIVIRGRDLCHDIMGHSSFTQFFAFHMTGREPTPEQLFFLDMMLVGLAEHGLTPSVQAARMTLAAAPEALQGAVAAGILGCGSIILGSSEVAGRYLANGVAAMRSGQMAAAVADQMLADLRSRRDKLPGFGHPLHQPEDPRAVRLLALADERGVSRDHIAFLRATAAVADRVYGRHIPINMTGAIAAVLLDLDFPIGSLKSVAILARTAGLLAHLQEEMTRPIGFLLAHHAEEAIEYDGGGAVGAAVTRIPETSTTRGRPSAKS